MAGDGRGLVVKDKIEVPTENGPCEIHLVYGSVTKLERKDEVDVLVLSAFPNSYAETPYSVIGALRRDLGIVVSDLAKNKEEDLRNIFSCWWSKELPPQCSFRRILCFEGAYKPGARPPSVIGEIFRSLVSLCKNNDIKVMMPMIATGHQGYEYDLILRLTVEAAIHWMQIGLPLRILKIVVYSKDLKQTKGSTSLIDYFGTLKRKWLVKEEKKRLQTKDPPINYDVYLSFSPKDQMLADKVLSTIKHMFKEISIFIERQEIDPEKSWQKQIYKVMVSCARVITILSPNFLADESCLEQYNIAMCCTRNMKRDYLAPFYVEAIDVMPTYMCLIQYIDCRPFSDANISNACSVVTTWLTSNLPKLKKFKDKEDIPNLTPILADHYEVFISYSHQNSEVAYQIKQHIMVSHPDWRIFIDVADLKTGVAWQTKLYDSIENSKIILALLSPAYIASKVCQEEYNLALALHCDASYTTVLFPVQVEQIEKIPNWCSVYEPMNMCENNVAEFLKGIKLLDELDKLCKPSGIDLTYLTEQWRRENINLDFPFMSMVSNGAISTFYEQSKKHLRKIYTVVLCYHPSDKSCATFFAKRLKSYLLNPILLRPQESSKGNLLIDEADMVVLFLSPAFLSSPELVEQANIALCRQRVSDRLIMLSVLLANLPKDRAYLRLFTCFFSCTDEMWLSRKVSLKNRIGWMCSLKASDAVCLDSAASFAGFVVSNADFFQGSYKTLLNAKEMQISLTAMREKVSNFQGISNLLYLDDIPVSEERNANKATDSEARASHDSPDKADVQISDPDNKEEVSNAK